MRDVNIVLLVSIDTLDTYIEKCWLVRVMSPCEDNLSKHENIHKNAVIHDDTSNHDDQDDHDDPANHYDSAIMLIIL